MPQWAIPRSRDSEVLSLRAAPEWHMVRMLSEYGCYRALLRHGIPAEFVSQEEALGGGQTGVAVCSSPTMTRSTWGISSAA
jgi:hypothetical protein